jgi:predicted dehydrogenase
MPIVGDLVAQIEVSRVAPAPLSTGWIIAGASASYAGFTRYRPNPDGEVVDLPVTPVRGEVDEFYAQLVRHVRFGEPNPVPAEEARDAIALISAARQSARTGQIVSINEARTVLIH